VELRNAFAGIPDARIVWVMADNQINEKTHRFIDTMGLADRIVFAVDRRSAAIDRLGIRLEEAEEIEYGVPHPTTYVLDREGLIRFHDSRRDYHFWLDSSSIVKVVAGL